MSLTANTLSLLTKKKLYEIAKEYEIYRRSVLNKQELIEAILMCDKSKSHSTIDKSKSPINKSKSNSTIDKSKSPINKSKSNSPIDKSKSNSPIDKSKSPINKSKSNSPINKSNNKFEIKIHKLMSDPRTVDIAMLLYKNAPLATVKVDHINATVRFKNNNTYVTTDVFPEYKVSKSKQVKRYRKFHKQELLEYTDDNLLNDAINAADYIYTQDISSTLEKLEPFWNRIQWNINDNPSNATVLDISNNYTNIKNYKDLILFDHSITIKLPDNHSITIEPVVEDSIYNILNHIYDYNLTNKIFNSTSRFNGLHQVDTYVFKIRIN